MCLIVQNQINNSGGKLIIFKYTLSRADGIFMTSMLGATSGGPSISMSIFQIFVIGGHFLDGPAISTGSQDRLRLCQIQVRC